MNKIGSNLSIALRDQNAPTNSQITDVYLYSREETLVNWQPFLNITTSRKNGCIPVSSPVSTQTYKVNNTWLNYTIPTDSTWFGYSLDFQSNVTINNNGSVLLTNLQDGSHTVQLYSLSTVNNSVSAPITFGIDVYPENITTTITTTTTSIPPPVTSTVASTSTTTTTSVPPPVTSTVIITSTIYLWNKKSMIF